MIRRIRNWLNYHLCREDVCNAWLIACDIGWEAGKAGKEKPAPPPRNKCKVTVKHKGKRRILWGLFDREPEDTVKWR